MMTDNAQIIERYKQMLNRKPKEGSTFDRLYQFYLEGAGLDAMVADYQAEAAAKPDAPNLQLILGHIHKRLGKDTEAIKAYQRAVDALLQTIIIRISHSDTSIQHYVNMSKQSTR